LVVNPPSPPPQFLVCCCATTLEGFCRGTHVLVMGCAGFGLLMPWCQLCGALLFFFPPRPIPRKLFKNPPTNESSPHSHNFSTGFRKTKPSPLLFFPYYRVFFSPLFPAPQWRVWTPVTFLVCFLPVPQLVYLVLGSPRGVCHGACLPLTGGGDFHGGLFILPFGLPMCLTTVFSLLFLPPQPTGVDDFFTSFCSFLVPKLWGVRPNGRGFVVFFFT